MSARAPRNRRELPIVSFVVLILSYAALGQLAVRWGLLTGDEGWYALAAQNVMHGRQPYRDFLFTQTPLMPYVYGLLLPSTGPCLATARYVSWLMGIASLVLTMATCFRWGGPDALRIAGMLFGLNLSLVFDTCNVKTQSLTILLVSACLFALSFFGTRALIVALGAMTLATSTRLSMAPALLVLWILVFLRERGTRAGGIVALNAAVLGSVAWLFAAGGRMAFGVYGFHREYYAGTSWSVWSFYGVFLKGYLANQLPIVLCGTWVLLVLVANPSLFLGRPGLRSLVFVAAAYLGTTAVHASRAVSYPTYQSSNAPFMVVIAACGMGAVLSTLEPALRRVAMGGLVVLVIATMPLQQFELHPNGDGSLPRLAQAAGLVRDIAHDGDCLLTWSTEVAVESGVPLLQGYEMSEFGFFPHLDEERARFLHVLTPDRVRSDLLGKRARIVCMTERHLRILGGKSPEWLVGALRDNFDHVGTIPRYGQFLENLEVFIARPGAE